MFPPGATTRGRSRLRSPWREFGFQWHQLQQAIDPQLPLSEVLQHWRQICVDLAECNRRRRPQIETLLPLS